MKIFKNKSCTRNHSSVSALKLFRIPSLISILQRQWRQMQK